MYEYQWFLATLNQDICFILFDKIISVPLSTKLFQSIYFPFVKTKTNYIVMVRLIWRYTRQRNCKIQSYIESHKYSQLTNNRHPNISTSENLSRVQRNNVTRIKIQPCPFFFFSAIISFLVIPLLAREPFTQINHRAAHFSTKMRRDATERDAEGVKQRGKGLE